MKQPNFMKSMINVIEDKSGIGCEEKKRNLAFFFVTKRDVYSFLGQARNVGKTIRKTSGGKWIMRSSSSSENINDRRVRAATVVLPVTPIKKMVKYLLSISHILDTYEYIYICVIMY